MLGAAGAGGLGAKMSDEPKKQPLTFEVDGVGYEIEKVHGLVEPKPITEEELAQLERELRAEATEPETANVSAQLTLRLVAEVRRLHGLATCEACVRGYRLTPDGLHYDDDGGGGTWGICRTQVLRSERAELARAGTPFGRVGNMRPEDIPPPSKGRLLHDLVSTGQQSLSRCRTCGKVMHMCGDLAHDTAWLETCPGPPPVEAKP
jgi:hypothetical protein